MPAGLTETIVAWESKGSLNEKNKPPTILSNSLSPKLKLDNSKVRIEFKGSCLKQG